MRIKVINPNTSASMTAMIGECARAVAGPGVVVDAVSPSMGPASIESHYDEALAVPGLLEQIALGEEEGADAYVVACFGDPGMHAARELATGPVIGIAQAAFHAAALVGRGFSVVTTLGRTMGRAHDLVHEYGFAERCRGIHACEIAVLDLETDPLARDRITAAARQAAATDGADVIVLGCAGMADLCGHISHEIGLPVVDGVAAGVLLAQSLVQLGLRPSASGEYAPPLPKAYSGLLEGFERGGTRVP